MVILIELYLMIKLPVSIDSIDNADKLPQSAIAKSITKEKLMADSRWLVESKTYHNHELSIPLRGLSLHYLRKLSSFKSLK